MMTRMHRFMYLVTTLTFALLAAGHRCPSDHPVAYNDGNHCCSSNMEKECGNLGPGCDGSFIGNQSRCCRGDEFVPCLQKPCENYYRVCTTETCKKVSERLFKTMNPEADPCENFEEFACGKFLRDTVISETLHTEILSQSDHIETTYRRAKKMLEKDPVEESPFETDKLLRTHYKSCMDLERIERESLPYAKRIMKYLGGFPAVEGASWDKHRSPFRWWDMVSKLPRLGLWTNMILKFGVDTDYNNTKSMAMYFWTTSLGISRRYLTKGFDHTEVKYYYDYMVGAAMIMGADKDTAHKDMKEALLFEIALANISGTTSASKRTTLRDLEGQPGYPPSVKSFIEQIYFAAGVSGINVRDDDEIIVRNPKYVEKLAKLLERTSERAIANYICWRVYDSFDRLMGNASRSLRELYLRRTDGIPSDPPRWARCGREVGVGWFQERLTVAIGSLYARNYFTEKDKEKADMIVNDIKKAFKPSLENNDWMDEYTRKNALEKLEALGLNIGYPASILKPEVLNDYFKSLRLRDSLLHNSLVTSRFWIQQSLKSLRMPVDRHHFYWHQFVVVVGGFTQHGLNYIDFPAGGLQEFPFNPEQPMYLNYGAIGSSIGNRLTASFYADGRKYNKDGNLIYWWDKDTLANFNKKAQCVVDQYGNYKSEQVGLHIDGKKSLNSNIEDIGGVRTAYSAYKLYQKIHGPEKPLVGHNYTPQQLFWINFAQSHCAKYTDEALRHLITRGETPSTYRIMGTLSNNPNFAMDFKCPLGSKMNPSKKCNLF